MDKSKAEQVTHFTLLFAFCAASMTHQDEEMGDFDLLPEFAQEQLLKAQRELFNAFGLDRSDFPGEEEFIFA